MTPVVAQTPPATPLPATPRGSSASDRSTLIVSALVCIMVAAPIAVFLWLAGHRVGYPYELDWMEGGSVELAARVAAGHSLYVAPSLRFVGWTYPPLYYWLSAAVAQLTGIGFLPLRLVSASASLVSMATLAWIVMRETGDRIAGLVAAGLFAATFYISGAWFDIGRVDSMFLALTLLTLAVGRSARGLRGGTVVGVLAFLAFFTKQTALLALLPALAYLVVARRRVGVTALLTLLALVVGSTFVLNAATDGWYGYYVFSELVNQPVAQQLWVGFWVDDIVRHQWPLLILILAGGATLAWRPHRRAVSRSPLVYWTCAAVGLMGSAWVSRLHTGGWVNVLMPAYAALALLAGLTYGALLHGRRKRIVRPALAVIVLVQLGLLRYPISAQIPTRADLSVGAALIARLRALRGPVVVLRHPWYATLAGKGSFAQEEALGDVRRSTAPRGERALRASLPGALDADHVNAVVLDGTFDAHFLGVELGREFRLQPQPITRAPLYPLTDTRTAPTLLYLRVGPTRDAAGLRSSSTGHRTLRRRGTSR